jgi:hypothetical protein
MNRREFTRGIAATLATGRFGKVLADGSDATLPPYAGPWVPLFNGSDLSGWTFYQDGVGHSDQAHAVVVEQGEIRMLGEKHTGGARPGMGHIATVSEYDNYHLRRIHSGGDRLYSDQGQPGD